MDKLVAVSTIPLAILNALAGLVSAVWLLILGEWQLPVYGLVITFVFPFFYSIITLPISLLLGGGAYLFDKTQTKAISKTAAILSNILHDVVNFGWIVLVFSFVIAYSDLQGLPLLPALLAAYAISTGGITYMASKETHNEFTMLTTFFVQLGAALMLLLMLIGLNFLGGLTLLVLLIVHTIIVWKAVREMTS